MQLSAQILGGTVVDRIRHEPVTNRVVAALDSTGVVKTATLDPTGSFYLELPHPGVYRLRVGDERSQDMVVIDSIVVGPDEFVQHAFAIPFTYFEFQVTHQAQQIPGTGNLRYPQALRVANTEGEVLVQFTVDEKGLIVPGSLKVIKSSDTAFTQAVRDALPDMRFYPADILGTKVRQIVQQPFTFSLSRY